MWHSVQNFSSAMTVEITCKLRSFFILIGYTEFHIFYIFAFDFAFAFISVNYFRKFSSQTHAASQLRYYWMALCWRPHWRTFLLFVRIVLVFALVLCCAHYGIFSFENSLFRYLRTSHWSFKACLPESIVGRIAWRRIFMICMRFIVGLNLEQKVHAMSICDS